MYHAWRMPEPGEEKQESSAATSSKEDPAG